VLIALPRPRAVAAERCDARPSRRIRLRDAAFDYGPALGVVLVVVVAVQIFSLLSPATAGALDLNPLHWAKSIVGGATSFGSSVFVKGFVAILNALFGGIEAKLSLQVLTWLTSIANQSGGHVAALYRLTSGMAIGLLGAVLTVSIVRYWVAGLSLSGAGGYEAVEGLLRTLGAVALLLVWPFFYSQLVALSNTASATVLGDPSLRREVAHIINGVILVSFVPVSRIGLFISIVIAVCGAILFLCLLFMKVMIGATITFLFVAMPLAIILWPIDELSWLVRYAMRAFISLLIIPVVWALIFATFAAVTINTLEFQGANGFVNQITQPLVAIAMLWLTITIPRTLFKLASSGLGMGRHGGGFVSRAGSYLAARQAGEFLAENGMLPFGSGGFASSQGAPRAQRASGAQTGAVKTTTTAGAGGAGAAAAGPVGAAAAAALAVQSALSTGGGAAAAAAAEAPTAAPAAVAAGPEPDREAASGPSVGATRPLRDESNPVDARPPGDAATQQALKEAITEAKSAEPPSLEEAHAARRRLGPDVLTRMDEAYENGGAPRVQSDMAMLATSDRISNAQARDFMTLASASGAGGGMLESLLGRQAPSDTAPFSAPSATPATSGTKPPQPSTPAQPSASRTPTSPPAPPQDWSRSSSAHARTRNDAWRDAGDGINPTQE
jgi:hypothetical protein